MSIAKQTFSYGSHTVTLETGRLARQADGAVLVTMSDTVVLVTAVARKQAVAGRDFFPLTVNYQEKTYAASTCATTASGPYQQGRPRSCSRNPRSTSST